MSWQPIMLYLPRHSFSAGAQEEKDNVYSSDQHWMLLCLFYSYSPELDEM